MTQPLAGLRVLELGNLIAGPVAARVLGEFGAEVIKVEAPGSGDPLRQWRKIHHGTSLWWYVQARNKKSITVNLKHPDGQEIIRRLAAEADVVVENFRPGVMEKLGLGWALLSAANPGLVMLRLSGFGQTGPYAQQPGFGAVGESMGGLRYVTGFPDRPPVKPGISIGDGLAALWGAIGTLIALRHRDATGGPRKGQGQVVDVALYEAVFAMMESLVPEFDVMGFIRERTGNVLPGITPSNTHATRDGKYVTIGGNGDAIFRRLAQAMGRDDLANDPQLATNAGRDERAQELYAAIDRWTSDHDLETIIQALRGADVPVSKVYSVEDMLSDPQYLARQMFDTVTLPDGRSARVPAVIPKLTVTPGGTAWIGPKLGEHTESVLGELGYPPDRIVGLRESGVI